MALTQIDDRGLKTPIDLLDNEKIRLGTGNDLELYHNGTHSYLDNGTGYTFLRSDSVSINGAGGSETMAAFIKDGACELYHDNVKRFETHSEGTYHYGHSTFIIGDEGESAQLFLHADDGDDNADKWKIVSAAGGNFYLQNYTSGSWESNLIAYGDGATELYYDNSKKFSTINAGAYVTGSFGVGAATNPSHNYNQGIHVHATGTGATLHLTDNTSGSGADDGFDVLSNAGEAFLWQRENSHMRFGTNATERMRIDSSGNVNIGITSQFDSNKVNILGTKAYSSGIPQQQLNVADDQAYSTTDNGGTISFSAKYNSGGAYTTMASIEGVKHNNIDGNYQGAIAFKTRNNNGDNVIRMRLTDNGLCFGTDTAGANALDDYEEGSFNPTVASGGTVSSYTHQYGYYIKIGRVVHWQIYMAINGTGSSGGFTLGSFPFTSGAYNSTAYGVANVGYANNTFQTDDLYLYFEQNSTTLIFRNKQGQAIAGNSGAIFGNADFIISGSYITA